MDDLDKIKEKIFFLEAALLFQATRLRAIQDAVSIVYQEHTKPPLEDTQFRSALREMEVERLNEVLAEYADKDMKMASFLKTLGDKEFGTEKENP